MQTKRNTKHDNNKYSFSHNIQCLSRAPNLHLINWSVKYSPPTLRLALIFQPHVKWYKPSFHLGIFPKRVSASGKDVYCVQIRQLISVNVEDIPQSRHAGYRGGHQEAGRGHPERAGHQARGQPQALPIRRPVPGGGRAPGGAGGVHWQPVTLYFKCDATQKRKLILFTERLLWTQVSSGAPILRTFSMLQRGQRQVVSIHQRYEVFWIFYGHLCTFDEYF